MLLLLLLLLFVALTTAQLCVLDSFDRASRNDRFERASVPFVGAHRAQTLCRNAVDSADFLRYWCD
jgi:hypothetical protein